MTSIMERSPQRRGTLLMWVLSVAFLLLVWVFPSGMASLSRREWTVYAPPWYTAASIIGCVYFFVGAVYFYNKFIVPFKYEARRTGLPPSGLLGMTLQWFVPMFMVHVFIVLGPFLTIERSPTKETIYSHAYMYGLIFARNSGITAKETEDLWPSADKYKKYLKGSQPAPDQQMKAGTQRASDTTASSSQTVAEDPPEASINKIPYLIAVGFGFLGTSGGGTLVLNATCGASLPGGCVGRSDAW